MRRRNAFAAACLIALTACQPQEDEPLLVTGSVTTASGAPLPGAVVTIEEGTLREPDLNPEFDGAFAFHWEPIREVNADASGKFAFEALLQFFRWHTVRWVAPAHPSGTRSTLEFVSQFDTRLVPLAQWDAHLEPMASGALRLVVSAEHAITPDGPAPERLLEVFDGDDVIWREPLVDGVATPPRAALAGRMAPVALGHVRRAGVREQRTILGDLDAGYWTSSWLTAPVSVQPPEGWGRVAGLKCVAPAMDPCPFADGRLARAFRPDVGTSEPEHSDWRAPIVLSAGAPVRVHAVVVHGLAIDLVRNWLPLMFPGNSLNPESPDHVVVEAAPFGAAMPGEGDWTELVSWRLPAPPPWATAPQKSQEHVQGQSFASEMAGRYLQAELSDDRDIGWVRLRVFDASGAPSTVYGLAELTLVTR